MPLAIASVLANVADWTHTNLEAAVKAYCETTGLGLGKVAQPIRVAVSGTAVAVGRTIIAVLENHQRDDGTVEVPACLLPYGAPKTISAPA